MLGKSRILLFFAALLIIPSSLSCSATKDMDERRNYMIPKKSEMPANSRYKEAGKKKTYNYKAAKSRQKSYF